VSSQEKDDIKQPPQSLSPALSQRKWESFSWQRGEYSISTDRSLLDFEMIHSFLSNTSYWAKDAHGLYERFGFRKLHRPERWMERFDPNMQESPDYWQPR